MHHFQYSNNCRDVTESTDGNYTEININSVSSLLSGLVRLAAYHSVTLYYSFLYFKGIINTVAAVQGFTGTYLAGYILHMTESWSRVFSMAGGVTLLSWLVFVIYGQGTSIID